MEILMDYDKPFQDISQQVEVLQNKGLIILDPVLAENILMTVSYYDLVNGYKEVFIKNKVYIKNTSIEDLFAFWYLDKRVQALTIKYSLIIETIFKQKLSYVIAKNIGVDEKIYLNPKYYKKKAGGLLFNNLKIDIMRLLSVKHSKAPTKYYIKSHNHVPPWILLKNASFGISINMFKFLSTKDKAEVANLLIQSDAVLVYEKIELIISFLEGLRKFRNYAAHNLKFITCQPGFKLPGKTMYRLYPKYVIRKYSGDISKKDKGSINGLYGLILMMIIFTEGTPLAQTIIEDYSAEILLGGNIQEGIDMKDLLKKYCNCLRLPEDMLRRFEIIKSIFR